MSKIWFFKVKIVQNLNLDERSGERMIPVELETMPVATGPIAVTLSAGKLNPEAQDCPAEEEETGSVTAGLPQLLA